MHLRQIQHLAYAVTVLVAMAAFCTLPTADAANSVPRRMMYNARLMKPSGGAVTTEHKVRFTFWVGANAVPEDLTGTGAINHLASNYVGWTEEQTFTPDANGYFSLEMGAVRPVPGFSQLTPSTLSNLYLQVEVKPSGSPDTAYEILDPKPLNASIDRSPLLAVPFALNADRLDQRDVGTGSGSIPVLGSGGMISAQNAARATNADIFTIDADNSAPDQVSLRFGQQLNKKLTFDVSDNSFIFNANLRVEGDLTVTGLINGVDISSLGSGSILLTYHPGYKDAAYQPDGSGNVGQLTLSHDDASKRNQYVWTSTRSTLQDYDVVLPFTLPNRFARWQENPVTLRYKTASADAGDNKVDVMIIDTAGNPVTVNGGSALASASWAQEVVRFGGSPSWMPGGTVYVKIRTSSRNGQAAHIGEIEMRYLQAAPE